MNPNDASVYTDTWAPMTWAGVLACIVIAVILLMAAFIGLVHRSIDNAAPEPSREGLSAGEASAAGNPGSAALPTPPAAQPTHAA